jgi:hypothetical protein
MAKTKSGPGRAQGKGRSAEGRATAKGGAPGGSRIGRYTPAEESGRYTPPVPKNVRKSPRWMGALILILLLGGVLMILLNYLSVLPGSVTVWYLIGGLVLFFSGFMLATRYH